ncbi:helix-turn-helix domain-containing protein [Paenibacillus sp. FSL L8-0708]|uniref:helix-turn-helix domain-containing protein n=1 Tax=Paenibacillus sp. FSL L8-0708 TaxID=2975311 RepID=UPI0030FB5BCF
MGLERYSWRNKLFPKYLLSYFIVILITLIINFGAWLSFIQATETEIESSHYNALEKVKELTDAKLQELYMTYVQTAMDSNVQTMLQWEGPLQPRHILTLVQIQKKLNSYELANPVIDNIYLYFEQSDVAISVNGQHSAERFVNSVLPHNQALAGAWIEKYYRGFMLYHPIENRNAIVYIQPLTNRISSTAQGKLIILIRQSSIDALMQNMRPEPQAQLFIRPSSETNTDYGPNAVVTTVDSNVGDFTYVSLIPKSIFFSKAARSKILFTSNLLVCILIGSVIAYRFAKRNYTPVEKLIRSMEQEVKEFRGKADNEYDFIQRALSKIVKEKDQFASKISQQGEILRSYFLQQWMKGSINPDSICEIAKVYGIPIEDQDAYQIIIINIHDLNYFLFNENMERSADENLALSRFILKNIMEECINETHQTQFFDSDQYLIGLIRIAGRDVHSQGQLKAAISKGKDFIESKFRIRILVSANSSPVYYKNVARAYEEAKEAMDLQVLLGENGILFFNEWKKGEEIKETGCNNPMQDQAKIVHFILKNDWVKVRELMHAIFVKWFSLELSSIQLVKSRMFMVIHSLTGVFEDPRVLFGKEAAEKIRPNDRLFKCQTLQELRDEATLIIDELEKIAKGASTTSGEDLYNKAVEYINRNYTQHEITISGIAERFEVNVSYLSKHFKKHMGIGPLDYLQFVRVQKAKELLVETDNNVKDIMLEVGFVDNVSFIRVFKKYEGTTPGAYRKTNFTSFQ